MKNKQVAVFGLGIFGSTLSKKLGEHGYEVMAVDIDMERIEKMAPFVTTAVSADVTDREALEALDIASFDIAVVSMGSKLEASIQAVLNLKELGIKKVIAKTRNKTNKIILEKIGADEVILPEKEMGLRLASRIMSPSIIDMMQFSGGYAIVEIAVPSSWIGKSLESLNVRSKYNVNIVAVSDDEGHFNANIEPSYTFKEDDDIVVIGETSVIHKLK